MTAPDLQPCGSESRRHRGVGVLLLCTRDQIFERTARQWSRASVRPDRFLAAGLYPTRNGPTTSALRLGFSVSSASEAVAAMVANGSSVTSGPKQGPWGVRAVVTDPDGHKVELVEAALQAQQVF